MAEHDRNGPDDVGMLVERGLAGLGRGEWERSVEAFDAALAIESAHIPALLGRGRAWQHKGEVVRAVRDFDEVIRLDPTHAEAFGHRGTAWQSQGEDDRAIRDYDRAIRLAPDLPWLYNRRGTALFATGDLDAALADQSRAIHLDPGFVDAYRDRGQARLADDDLDGALADLDAAIRIDPGDARSFSHRAQVRIQREEFEEALADFTEAIRLDPSEAAAYRGRAFAREALDRDVEAEADHRQADRLEDEDEGPNEGGTMTERKAQIHALLQSHFEPTSPEELTITERQFPHRVRADLQRAVDRVVAEEVRVLFFCGVRKQHSFEGISLTELMVRDRHNPAQVVAPLYEEVDVGEDEPVRCLKNGLWLLESDGARFAVLIEQHSHYGRMQVLRAQLATTNDPRGFRAGQAFLKRLEDAVQKAGSYRGKILSLEENDRYSGQSSGIQVHKLGHVERDQVILPSRTLELLDRNVVGFIAMRPRLRALGQSIKKGILFYGPPGTGKTHTIHYLAAAVRGHTTLLVTAEQVGLLDEYMALARLLQPSIVVIEDADLIARDREAMESPCEEVLLNKLLNEMDGLRPDSEILFILTTNRPEALEAALASRPGRVDQAIEFPLPDDDGRRKLVRLYARGVEVPDGVLETTVRRTEGVSASFIKELLRRSTQFHLERDASPRIDAEDVDAALDELLFSGGSLNRKLLGGRLDD